MPYGMTALSILACTNCEGAMVIRDGVCTATDSNLLHNVVVYEMLIKVGLKSNGNR